MELAIDLGWAGWVVVLVAALVFGVAAQLIGETRTGYEWLVDVSESMAYGSGPMTKADYAITASAALARNNFV